MKRNTKSITNIKLITTNGMLFSKFWSLGFIIMIMKMYSSEYRRYVLDNFVMIWSNVAVLLIYALYLADILTFHLKYSSNVQIELFESISNKLHFELIQDLKFKYWRKNNLFQFNNCLLLSGAPSILLTMTFDLCIR